MKLRWSKFVSFVKRSEGKFADHVILFNSFNRGKLLLAEADIATINEYLETGIATCAEVGDVVKELQHDEFLVDASYDEATEYDKMRQRSLSHTDEAKFYFTPTFNCNFKCSYCIVEETEHNLEQRAQFMTDEMVGHTAHWIIDFCNELAIKKLEILFFGGEPTLGNRQNIMLMKQLNEHKHEGFDISASFITNGYYYNEAEIRELIQYGLYGVQITVDGPAEIHDRRRVMCDGSGTFDIIMENVQKYMAHDFLVNIRINIDPENAPHIKELLDVFMEKDYHKYRKFVVSFAPVDPNSEYGEKGYSRDALQWYDAIYTYAHQNGFTFDIWNTFCGAYRKNLISIAPDGTLYMCPSYTGFKEQIIGNVVDGKMNDLYTYYINYDIPKRCKTCQWVGVCNGGCYYVKNTRKNPDQFCMKPVFDALVSAFLRATYDDKRIEARAKQGTPTA